MYRGSFNENGRHIRLSDSRLIIQTASTPPGIHFFLSPHVQVSEEHGAIQSLIIICEDFFSLFKTSGAQVYYDSSLMLQRKLELLIVLFFFDLSMVLCKFTG